MISRLTVLYDADCALCRDVRDWMLRQEPLVLVDYVSARSGEAQQRFPDLSLAEIVGEFHVVADDRIVYRGAKAFVMCLWALRDHRDWAMRLADPRLLPTAARTFQWLSRNRTRAGWLRSFFRGTPS